METKMDFYKERVLEVIKPATKAHPVLTKDLREQTNLSTRQIKRVITELREDYPIVSKETHGGGYWIAKSEDEIIDFVQILQRRLIKYEGTIRMMNKYVADYGNIPFVD